MRKKYICIILSLCGLVLSANANTLEYAKERKNPRDSIKIKKAATNQLAYLQQLQTWRSKTSVMGSLAMASKTQDVSNTTLANSNAQALQATEAIKGRVFANLDKKLLENSHFNIPLSASKPEFNQAFIANNFTRNPRVDTLEAQAKKAFNEVKKLGNFTDIITGNELLELPVGLRKKVDSTSQNSVELAIVEVKFTPQYAEFKAWAKLIIPQKGENGEPERELYFGAEGIKLSHDGALLNGMKLVLLGDTSIPINGDHWLLTLKGGIDLKTGTFTEKSYIEFDCTGLKKIGLEGDLRISRKVLLPIDEKGEYTCGDTISNQYFEAKKGKQLIDNKCYVGTSFSIHANGWNDLLIETNFPRFEVVGLKGWGFTAENVVLDLSDSRSASNFQLPESYNTLYNTGNIKLWRGFYAKEISITLPKGVEDNTTADGRTKFSAQDLIIDSQGVSGAFYGENVLNIGEGSAGKWAFTVNDISLTLTMNTVTAGSMGGDITVPILKEPMLYEGYIASTGWGLEVGRKKDFQSPVFLGEIILKPNSKIGINVKEGHVYPYANLTGQLSIAGKINQKADEEPPTKEAVEADSKGFSFPNIEFEELALETEPGKKLISAKSFGFTGDMGLMGFPAKVSDLELITPANQLGLSFDLVINLDKEGSHASTSLNIIGDLKDEARIQEWKFNRVKVDSINIKYSKSGLAMEGALAIMEDDPTYGDGFSGELSATFEKLDFSATGRAMFGKKDFRYWFVDIWSEKTEKTGDTKLPIKSFVGGVSNRMRKVSGNTTGFDLKTAKYHPSENTGLGVRAGVKIETNNSGTFSGKAYLEMEFNTNGGLNRIGFIGEGAFMIEDKGFEGVNQNQEVGKVFTKVNDFIEKNKETADKYSKYGSFLSLSKEAIPVRDVAAKGAVGAYVGIEKDFENNTFDGEFELYMDLQGVKGGGANNLAGYAKIHTSPEDWYIYLGTPQKRIELVFNAGAQIRVGGYFMTGTVLPSQLDPHPTVVKILGDDMLNGNRQENQLDAGRGFAFGLNFGYGYGFDWKLFYAFVEVGAGFDVMHAYYPDAKCVGRPGPIGNNGWYSMGQVYAYVYGEFGVKVNLLFIKGKFVIAEAGIAAMLRGQFPNPVYIQGYAGMYYSILGGLVKGRMRLKMEIGEKCELENMNTAIGVPMISDITPRDKSDEASVFSAPQAIFNYAANKDFTVDLDEGKKTFKLRLKSFTVTSEGKTLEGELEWNDTNDAVTFKPAETLPSEKEVKVVVEVSFDEKIKGSYQTVIQNGKPAVEKLESVFITDKAPGHIPLENIVYMYPVLEQQSFYPEEYNKGYVKMKTPQNYLFENGYEMRAEFMNTTTGQGIRTNLSYDRGKGTVFYDIPKMNLNNNYELNLMAFPPGADIQTKIITVETDAFTDEETGDTNWYNVDGNNQAQGTVTTTGSAIVSNKKASDVKISQDTPKSILKYNFKTSRHASFKNKVRSLKVTDNLTNFIYADVHSLSIKIANYEYLSKLEIIGNKYTGAEPLIYAQAILDDRYYKEQIYGLLYESYPLDGDIRVNRDENLLGLPPIRSFYIGNEYINHLDANASSAWVQNRIPFVYNLPYQYKLDMLYLRNKIANRYSSTGGNQAMYERYKYIIQRSFPPLPLGIFKAQLIYRTPGNIYQKGYQIKYRND
ncbi:hypothetical protein FEZ18_09080 [Oceanihabitans sp. IOP_32]|uniref:hypothetical protein n=1 Tax=Oceanihabitans sp. IOP_32 TaxID=2529032 RepID=UPI0012934075|nr:hypothetical protein [Oceanihabitans sp. IOP_32]QFZ54940.1 hypothetical protein FEZ18_09080 [Oceanihabitans sp. IOP_32]